MRLVAGQEALLDSSGAEVWTSPNYNAFPSTQIAVDIFKHCRSAGAGQEALLDASAAEVTGSNSARRKLSKVLAAAGSACSLHIERRADLCMSSICLLVTGA